MRLNAGSLPIEPLERSRWRLRRTRQLWRLDQAFRKVGGECERLSVDGEGNWLAADVPAMWVRLLVAARRRRNERLSPPAGTRPVGVTMHALAPRVEGRYEVST